jgi:hypothetical protein
MSSLSVSQWLVLSTAAGRADGAVLPLPDAFAVRGRARQLLLQGLTQRGLIAASSPPGGEPVSTEPDADRGIALQITAEGRALIHAAEPAAPATTDRSKRRSSAKPRLGEATTDLPPEAAVGQVPTQRPGTKQALLVELLGRPDGATVTEIQRATGWQPHSVRAAVTGLRKRRFAVTLGRRGDGTRFYRVPSTALEHDDGVEQQP